jgi:hypothetical protein
MKEQKPSPKCCHCLIDDYRARPLGAQHLVNRLNPRVDRQENIGALLWRIFTQDTPMVPLAFLRKYRTPGFRADIHPLISMFDFPSTSC